ncbi:YesL family protein [Neobacillus vireti]|uniref:YesL family protein n=1 Tax=Neobacillus vireti TaxID=220686 RepID=UPI003000182C
MLQIDGWLYRMCTWIYHFTLLNLIFLISCIPIITIFPATAAAFGVARQWVKKKEPPIVSTYIQLLKENFRQSMVVGVSILIMGLLLYGDFQIITKMDSNIKIALYMFFCLMTVFYFMVVLHVFPLMVNGYYTGKQLLINALKFGLYKFHLTLINMICLYGLLFISLKFPVIFIFFFSSIAIFITYWLSELKFTQFAVENGSKSKENRDLPAGAVLSK